MGCRTGGGGGPPWIKGAQGQRHRSLLHAASPGPIIQHTACENLSQNKLPGRKKRSCVSCQDGKPWGSAVPRLGQLPALALARGQLQKPPGPVPLLPGQSVLGAGMRPPSQHAASRPCPRHSAEHKVGMGAPAHKAPVDHPPDAPLNQPARRPGPGPSPPEGPTQLGQGTMPTPAMVSCPPLPTTLPSLEAFLASSDQAHAAWPCDTQASPGDSGLQKPLEVAQNGCPCSPGP